MSRWLLVVLLCAACTRAPERRQAAAKPRAVTEAYLGEWLALPGGRCKVSQAEAPLTESAHLPFASARLKPDVRAVDVRLSCETEIGAPARSRETLPNDLTVLLSDGAGHTRAPRPLAQDEAEDRFVFELPSDTASPLLAVRRYDTRTGKASVARERSVSQLVLRGADSELRVTLRPRFRDGAFDVALDALAERLARGEELSTLALPDIDAAQLTALTKIYGEVRERFGPARLELSRAEQEAEGVVSITLSLTRPQRASSQLEVARFELTLQAQGDGYKLAAFNNREQARSALRCGELRERLEQELAQLNASGSETCNVAGELLPGSCASLHPSLLARGLSVGMECRGFAELERKRANVPGDFQLTMRRGRTGTGLDRSPRYVVALFENGHVVFHGRHWVSSQERSDGRTHRALLSALYAHVEQLDWFGRRGGQFDMERCIPSEDLGDVITVVARERQRMVLNREGCRGPFSEVELTDLRRHVEQVAGVEGWTAPRKESVDRGVQHWAIAE